MFGEKCPYLYKLKASESLLCVKQEAVCENPQSATAGYYAVFPKKVAKEISKSWAADRYCEIHLFSVIYGHVLELRRRGCTRLELLPVADCADIC